MIKSMILAAALAFCMPAMATAAGPPEEIADAVFTERIGDVPAGFDLDIVVAAEPLSDRGFPEGFGAITDYEIATDPFLTSPGREVPAPKVGSLT